MAPVRETAAQALGAATRACSSAQKLCVLQNLRALTQHSEWQVRQAGFLGLKYLLAAQKGGLGGLLQESYNLAMAGLQVALVDQFPDQYFPVLPSWISLGCHSRSIDYQESLISSSN